MKKDKRHIHLMIIWSEASYIYDQAIKYLEDEFIILRMFRIKWTESFFLDNLRMFYSHSQRHLSPSSYTRLLQGKMKHCGTNEFHAIVFEDPQPNYDNRETSNGCRKVNAHVFDLKSRLRAASNGGHKIHTSDDAWETNKDLTLLFGLNTKDFLEAYPPNKETYFM